MRQLFTILPVILLMAVTCMLAGCPASLDSKIRENTRVPGLDEATQSVDRALESAIKMNIQTDPCLDYFAKQHGLTVEVSHSVVTVNMTVYSEHYHEQVIDLAGRDDRIKELIDEVTIDPTIDDCPVAEIWN